MLFKRSKESTQYLKMLRHSHSRVFKSKLPDLPHISNDIPLHIYSFQKLSQFADRPCLIEGSADGRIYTFAETYLICRKTAAGLFRMGINKGDCIMILLHNCPEFVFSFLAASMVGAITTTANPLYTSAEVFKQIKASKTKLIITSSRYVDKLRTSEKFGEDFSVITIDDPPENCRHFSVLSEANENEDLYQTMVDSNEAVALPFSSGTTGLPKGVILTHKSMITSVAQQVDGENPNLYLNKNDVVLCVLPLFHIFALNFFLCSLRAGAAVVLMPKFEIRSMLEIIQRYRVSTAALVPPLILALAKNPIVESFDISSLKKVVSGAAPLGKELQAAFCRRVPQAIFGQGYGMTEAGPVLTMSLAFAKKPFSTKSGSCGTVVRNAKLKIIDTNTGSPLGYNESGEICIRGTQIMKGYLNDEVATAATIDEQGWLHTGDIGYVDSDDEVYIVDRVKELIKFQGFQVPPAELEALLVSHTSILDAAVVSQKDEVAREVPVAFVVQSSGSELTEGAIKNFIAKQVVFYKKLHKVYFVDAIPKSPSGKILRKILRDRLAAAAITSSL